MSVLALLILIVVLSSMFFTVGKISVVWHTDKVKLEDATNEQVVSGEFVSNTTNAIKIEGDFAFDEVAGEFLTASGTLSAFKTLQQSFYENYYEDENEFYVDDMLAFFKSASYTDTKITFETFFGVKVEIYNPGYKQQQKIAMFLLQIESLTETQKTTGTIIIGDYNDKVQGSYTSHVDE